jgi:Icc-related predicted phosphoesterase
METGNFKNIPDIESADHIIITGDITNYGNDLDAESVLNRMLPVNNNIMAVAGNLDQPEVARYLEDAGISLHARGVMVDGLGIVGLGGSNFTPFNTPYEFSEEELGAFLAAGYEQLGEAEHHILVSHTPPVQTRTDRLMNGSHVGSKAVRSYIEEHQPLLCLCGHIHESAGQDNIGRTQVLNPGMLKDGGYIEVLFEDSKITATLHT